MLDGYHLFNKRHALQSLVSPTHMPNVSLAVDKGELLFSMNMKQEYINKKPSVVIPDIHTIPYQVVSPNSPFADLPSESDIPKSHYLGDAIVGW